MTTMYNRNNKRNMTLSISLWIFSKNIDYFEAVLNANYLKREGILLDLNAESLSLAPP